MLLLSTLRSPSYRKLPVKISSFCSLWSCCRIFSKSLCELLFPKYHFLKSSNETITKPSSGCVPSSVVMKRVLVYTTFIAEVEGVLTCQKASSTCQRLPRMDTYYAGTMYRRTIDVGVCSGLCQEEMACKPSSITAVAISTPNGKGRLLNLSQNEPWFICSLCKFNLREIMPSHFQPEWFQAGKKLFDERCRHFMNWNALCHHFVDTVCSHR